MRYLIKLVLFCGPVLLFYNEILSWGWAFHLIGGSSVKLTFFLSALFFFLSISSDFFLSNKNLFDLSEFSFNKKSINKISLQFLVNIFFIGIVFILKIKNLDVLGGRGVIVVFAFFLSESFVYFFKIVVHFVRYRH